MFEGTSISELITTPLISATVISAVIGLVFKGFLTKIEAEVKSRRTWKEESVAELLAPINMQFDRTKRAFKRWSSQPKLQQLVDVLQIPPPIESPTIL